MYDERIVKLRILFAAISLGIACVSLFGWATGNLVLASYYPGWKAMAPMTSVSIILLSCGVMFNGGSGDRKKAVLLPTAIVMLIAIFAIFERTGLISRGFESVLIPEKMTGLLSSVNTGVMSPLTVMVLFSLSLFLMVFKIAHARWVHAVMFIAGILTVYTGLIDLSGYIVHNPILSGIISCPTGISFVLLGTAFVFCADAETFPARILLGNSTAAVILRRIVPVVVLIIFLQGIIFNIPSRLSFNPVFIMAAVIALFTAMVLGISVGVSSSMGKMIERLVIEKEIVREKYLQSEKKYGILIESLQEGVAILTREGMVVYANRRTADILSFHGKEIVNRKLSDFIVSVGEEKNVDFNETLANDDIRHDDYRIALSGDVPRYVSITFVPISRGNGTGGDFIAGIVDVTEKKSVEKKLRESLKNREVLLRELYHRTKNNMQVICSFIRLCRGNPESGESYRTFIDLENRILAMSLVHDKLCESDDLSSVNIREYTMDLAGLLSREYASVRTKVGVGLDIPDIMLPIDVLVPYGLIMSELFTNSFKHAFSERDAGTIHISIIREEDVRLRCVYMDDGKGVVEIMAENSRKTLGLRLVDSIVTKQLGGTLSIIPGDGFRLEFVFRTDLYNSRL